ncbi:MAG TPA: S24 family peptidase, partial [Massilibacterium sp.]|nr:S24 family peptidase [Massilibacterium sp.]
SMTGAGIKEGDLLLIRHQEQVENGEIAVVVIDEQVVLKRVYRQNGDFILISENPSYPPRTFNPEIDNNIRIIGRLKKAITDF